MELREYAHRIVTAPDIDSKLEPASTPLSDACPGEPLRIEAPGRPPNLTISPVEKTRVPSVRGYHDPSQRARVLHSFANHELQAAELFAWALLAFPEAPTEFRRGLLEILIEEQRHTRMYCSRLAAHGHRLGDFPVSGYFWHKTPGITSPLRFVCAMSLTFENANLDHTIDSADAIRRAGDEKTARVVDQIHRDEIGHVRFGWRWLLYWKPADQTPWETYCENVDWPLRPALARGQRFYPEGRIAAGLDPEFVRRLAASEREQRPGKTRDAP